MSDGKQVIIDPNTGLLIDEEAKKLGEAQVKAAQPVKVVAKPAEKPVQKIETKTAVPGQQVVFAIGLKDYSTVIGTTQVFVKAGRPWSGPKEHYDILARAKLVQ